MPTRNKTIALILLFTTLSAQFTVLMLSGADAAAEPISQLSRGALGGLHAVGLCALAVCWLMLGFHCWSFEQRRLWRLACILLILSASLLPYIAWYFATADDAVLFGPNANDPLGVLASLLGVAMGALQPGLRRHLPRLAPANLLILVIWLALIPVIPFIESHWLGAYERSVGSVLLAWTLLLVVCIPLRPAPESTNVN